MDTTSHSERRRQYWLEHFDACAASGGTIKLYAQTHGLSVGSFYAARKRYARTNLQAKAAGASAEVGRGAPRFVRLERTVRPHVTRVGCRAHLANGAVVELDLDVGDLEGALRAFAAVS